MLLHTSCREPGVRNLQKQIEKLVRKVAFQIATKEAAKVTVTDSNLEKFVGPPIFAKDRIFDSTPAGVVMGLAWTSMGGATLFIESVAVASADKAALRCTGQVRPKPYTLHPKPSTLKPTPAAVRCTGQMEEVMLESIEIAVYLSIYLSI